MAITIKHAKTDTIADWTQADLDAQIALGNFPAGTVLADIVLPSDWNNDHTISGTVPIANGGTGQTTANAAINALLPSQSSQSGKVLSTDGTNTSWIAAGGTGTVTSVTGTAPVSVATGTTTPVISMAAATTSVNGYLTSTDWNTFNGKGNGTVTSITAGTGLSGGTITSSGTIAIDSTVVTLTGSQTLTNKILTSPVINEILDTNGNEILSFNPVASATDFISIKNGIGVGAPLHISAAGSSSNVGLHIEPKGTGLVTISDGTDDTKGIRFRSSGSATGAITASNFRISTAGGGIDFSVTSNGSGTMTSELLNDYEEGTWTPTFGGGGSDPTGVTYDGQNGIYTKIGRLVTVTFIMGFTTYTGGSGALYVRGLPFAATGTTGYNGAVQTEQITFSEGRTYAAIRVSGGGSVIDVQQMGGATTWTSFTIGTEITSSGTGKYIQGTVTYTAS
jgi:hypothetical protein